LEAIMNEQKFLIATLAGTVTSVVVGFLVYGLALNNFMTANMMAGLMKDPPEWAYLVLGQFAGSALLAMVIGRWAATGGAQVGFKIGAQVGLLMALAFDLTMLATSNMMAGFRVVAVDVVASTVITAITGAAVGAALGRRT
jgi:hypothetical protein